MAWTWLDGLVLLVYLLGMVLLGFRWAVRRRTDDDYFLVNRGLPWLVVGISVVASMVSSITYLSEPGEVWKSGVTHVLGRILGIPLAMLIVWGFSIPFLMRLPFTSAYEYLQFRFGMATRRTGAMLFVGMVVLWMGFVVYVLAQVIEQVSGIPLLAVILAVGVVATSYTLLGGLRAVVWTDVIQVALLVAGAAATVGYVSWTTASWLPDWFEAAAQRVLAHGEPSSIPLFSWDPTLRATVLTVAINMAVWQVCMHTSNQITIQRYFSTRDLRAARRGFVTSCVVHAAISLLLMVVGIAVLYFYTVGGFPIDGSLNPGTQRDLIFPTFVLHRLPAGLGGGMLAALLAAAMSTVDSGLNAIATVVSLELRPLQSREMVPAQVIGRGDRESSTPVADSSHVRLAMVITAIAGGIITAFAYGMTYLPAQWGIVGAIPRTFNAVTGPLGGLFLAGIFLPRVGQRGAITGACCGLVVSVVMGYSQQISERLLAWGVIEHAWPELSFTWILPCSLLSTLVAAPLLSCALERPPGNLAGLTWFTREQPMN